MDMYRLLQCRFVAAGYKDKYRRDNEVVILVAEKLKLNWQWNHNPTSECWPFERT